MAGSDFHIPAPICFCDGVPKKMYYVGYHGMGLKVFRCPACPHWGGFNKHSQKKFPA